jgi:hypothetical protein
MTFKKGASGNPAGRRRGIVDKRARFRKLFEADAKEVIAKVLELAKDGDMDACKLVLERCAPKLRDETPRRRIALDPTMTLEAQGRAVVAAIAGGDLTPDEGAALLNGLGRQGELEKLGVIADIVCKLAADRGIALPPELQVRRIPQTHESGA